MIRRRRKLESAYNSALNEVHYEEDSKAVDDLIKDVDDWFYNYFTLDNFDDTETLIDNLRALIQVHKRGILSACCDELVFDYKWSNEFIDKNYDLIVDQLCKNASWMLNKEYGIRESKIRRKRTFESSDYTEYVQKQYDRFYMDIHTALGNLRKIKKDIQEYLGVDGCKLSLDMLSNEIKRFSDSL